MRISARGWGRNLGDTEIMSADLREAETLGEEGRCSFGKTYKKVVNPENWRRTHVRITTSADLRFGGSYMLHVELSRREIAELFFETHTGSMVRMLRAFIDEEHREDHAQLLARIAELEGRRTARLAEGSGDATEQQS
jgi:hypothetical protein